MRVPSKVTEIKASIEAGIEASPSSGKLTTLNPLIPYTVHANELVELVLGWVLLGYLLSSFLAVVIPVSKWSTERNKYYVYAGKQPSSPDASVGYWSIGNDAISTFLDSFASSL